MKKRIKIEEINGVIYIDGVDILKLISDFSKENDRLKLENDRLKKLMLLKKSKKNDIFKE